MQLERELQLYLLTRCSSLGNEDEKAILLWAMERLQWLSPWQADYLPRAHLEMLAARLLVQELQKAEMLLHAGEERAALDVLVALAKSEWLQPFERRLQFQEGVLRLLEQFPPAWRQQAPAVADGDCTDCRRTSSGNAGTPPWNCG